MKSENLFAAIAAGAAQRGLPVLITGGHAVISHGFRRGTFDVDLIIDREKSGAWLDLLHSLDYERHHETETFIQFTARAQEEIPVDLMLVNTATLKKLLADAGPAPGQAPGVQVVSLTHLLALKCHAVKFGHSGRIVKDVNDLIELIKINRVDLREPRMKALITERGTPELYEKLVRATEG